MVWTETTTWSMPVTERFTCWVEREIDGFTSNHHNRLWQELSIRSIEFEASWDNPCFQKLPKIVEQLKIYYRRLATHRISHISESIQHISSGNHFTTDMSELLHIARVKEA